MEFDFNSKQIPAILPSFPPMPKPEDYGIDWQDAEFAQAYQRGAVALGFQAGARGVDFIEARGRAFKFNAQNAIYQQALSAWKEQVAQIAQAIRTNK